MNTGPGRAVVVILAAVFVVAIPRIGFAQAACKSGFVWREAFAGDHVCVTPETRTQAARDNREAAARREPGGGPSGPNTCRPGYVWREAKSGDVVCVTPEVRAQAASDNAAAAQRRVAAGSAGGAPPAAGAYRTSDWSPWKRTAGIEYRYRWGWNPGESRYAKNVDAIFQMRNGSGSVWRGAARSVDCSQNVLSRSTDAVVQPNETREVKFLTPNCGTLQNPWFKPDVVKAGRID